MTPFYNLHCKLVLDRAPRFDPGPGIADDKFYLFLEMNRAESTR